MLCVLLSRLIEGKRPHQLVCNYDALVSAWVLSPSLFCDSISSFDGGRGLQSMSIDFSVVKKSQRANIVEIPELGDSGESPRQSPEKGVLNCFYHTDRVSVNVCSKCEKAICSECNYVAGTSPICRNCWDELVSGRSLGVRSETKKAVRLKKIVKPKIQKQFVAKENIDKKDGVSYRAPLKPKAVSNGDINRTRSEPRLDIDKVADGIEFGLDKMGDGIIFSIEKLVNVFTWIFSTKSGKSKR
jgi:hypothetical protein